MYETEYLKLKVAEENDFYNINENSDNLKKIDEKFKEMEDPDTPNSLAEQVGLIESPSFVNHDSDTIGNVPICPVNSTNPPDVGGGSVPSGWKKVSALKSGEKLFSIFEKISTIAYNVKWLFKWLNSINTIGEYTSVDSQGNIVRVKNSASDVETGVPFPFPIQTVVEGHELALRQLNTDTRIKTLMLNYTLQADGTTWLLGNYGYYRCGMVLIFAASSITLETTVLLISTSSDAVEAGGTLKIVASNMNYNNTKTGCNDYYLWGGQLCIHNLQSVHEYLTVRFIQFP